MKRIVRLRRRILLGFRCDVRLLFAGASVPCLGVDHGLAYVSTTLATVERRDACNDKERSWTYVDNKWLHSAGFIRFARAA